VSDCAENVLKRDMSASKNMNLRRTRADLRRSLSN
jgi:hypothetical protein